MTWFLATLVHDNDDIQTQGFSTLKEAELWAGQQCRAAGHKSVVGEFQTTFKDGTVQHGTNLHYLTIEKESV